MSKKTINPACGCGCNTQAKVLTVTQLENQSVLEMENLENRDKILVLNRNINNAYMVKVMSVLTVKALVEAVADTNTAFLLVEMKEPAAPADPGTTTEPENPDGGNTENSGHDSEGGTEESNE